MLDLTAAFATFPVLETERLLLRAVTPADAPEMFRLLSDRRVTRYFGQPPMTALDQATERVRRMQSSFQERTGVRWVITSRTDGRFMGACGFWRLLPAHFRAEIGYELAPEWWGHGVMPEAVAAILTFGFTRMGLHSVEAQIHPDNTGSRRVLEKLGFVQEAYFRESYYEPTEDCFTDTAVFSLLKTTWLSRVDV